MSNYSCYICQADVQDDDIVWALTDGTLNTDIGYPYCVGCLPAQKEEVNV